MKIFGIGAPKTGTTSLAAALKILGFKTIDGPRGQNPIILGNLEKGRPLVQGLPYEAFTDSYVRRAYKELDAQYPSSKFILTVRRCRPWARSARNHLRIVGRKVPSNRMLKRHCLNYNVERVQYFEDKPEQLLIYSLCSGTGWQPLCEFLGVPVPQKPFPWKNRGQRVKKRKRRKRRF